MFLIGAKVVVSCRPYTCSLRIPQRYSTSHYPVDGAGANEQLSIDCTI